MVTGIPTLVSGETYGRPGLSALLHTMSPETHLVIQSVLILGLVIFAIAIVDLMLRGRFRNTSAALTGMLAALAPLMGVFAAANALMWAFVEVADRNISTLALIAVPMAEAALSVAVGAVVGGGAVLLKGVLKLADARRSTVLDGSQPRATKP